MSYPGVLKTAIFINNLPKRRWSAFRGEPHRRQDTSSHSPLRERSQPRAGNGDADTTADNRVDERQARLLRGIPRAQRRDYHDDDPDDVRSDNVVSAMAISMPPTAVSAVDGLHSGGDSALCELTDFFPLPQNSV